MITPSPSCTIGTALLERAAEHHPDSDWISQVLDGDPAGLTCEGPRTGISVVQGGADAVKAKYPKGAYRSHQYAPWQVEVLDPRVHHRPTDNYLSPDQLVEDTTVGGLRHEDDGHDETYVVPEFTVCSRHVAMLEPKHYAAGAVHHHAVVVPPKLRLSDVLRVPCPEPRCKGGRIPWADGKGGSLHDRCDGSGTIPDPRLTEAIAKAHEYGLPVVGEC